MSKHIAQKYFQNCFLSLPGPYHGKRNLPKEMHNWNLTYRYRDSLLWTFIYICTKRIAEKGF